MDVREKTTSKKRLIDANEYCMELYNEMNYPGRSEEFMTAIDVAIADLADAPTVDAVEVVRCREGKHRYTEDCPMYFHASYWHEGYEEYVDDDTDHTEDDYFCQEGEREEGADNEP